VRLAPPSLRYAGCANNQARKEGDMNSLKQVITEVTALQAVVSVLVRARHDDKEFRRQVIELVNHIASTLPPQEGDDLRVAAQHLIDA
jgi:hypothetical protein